MTRLSEFGTHVRDGLEATGRYAACHQRQIFVIVAVTALLSLTAGLGAVQMSMGMTLYIDEDSQTARDWETLKSEYDTGNNVFVLVESDQLYDPQTIRAIDRLDRRYEDNVGAVERVTSLADVVRAGADGEIPATETGVRRAVDRVETRGPESAAMVDRLTPETGQTIILASYGNVGLFDRGAFLPERGAEIVTEEIRSETEFAPRPPEMSTTVTGQSVFESAAFGLMLPEMITLFGGAFALIIGVVYVVMRTTVERGWHVFLPLGTAITALLYMMGAMGVLGYDFNAIMLGVMPIALGLGIDYTLQIHSRYIEERQAGHDPVDAAGVATRTTGRALLIAMGTTVVGLGSLLVSAVPPVRQFGVTSAVAVLAAMILAVTLLPALLVRFDGDSHQAPTDDAGMSDDWLQAGLARVTTNITGGRPLMTLLVAGLLVSAGAYAYPQVEPEQEMTNFWPQDLDAKEDIDELSDTVESPKVIYVMVSTDQAYTPETFRHISRYQQLMLADERVNAVESPVTSTRMATDESLPSSEAELDTVLTRLSRSDRMRTVRSPDETPSQLVLTFYIDDIEGESVRSLISTFDNNAQLTLTTAEDVQITGKPVLNRNVIENVTAGLTPMTLLSFGLGLAFLALAFLSIRISVVIIGSVAASASILVAGAMYVFGIPWNPLTITMSSLTLGIGVDYGIHLFERYEYEVEVQNADPLDAAATAVGKLSRPIIGSSFTTIFGFGVLTISRFPVLANFGKTTVLAIAFSLLTAFVILPAVLTVAPVLTTTADSPQPLPADSEKAD